jgi:hypothetical protein
MKTFKLTLVLILALLAANPSAHALFGMGEPPICLTTRNSLIGAGKVLIITNTSDETLHQITLGISNDKKNQEVKDAVVAVTLEPHKSIELGWMELNLAFEPGDSVRVGAKGYLSYVREKVPE